MRTATLLPKRCAASGRHRARPVAPTTRALVVSDQTTTITTATGQRALVAARNLRSSTRLLPRIGRTPRRNKRSTDRPTPQPVRQLLEVVREHRHQLARLSGRRHVRRHLGDRPLCVAPRAHRRALEPPPGRRPHRTRRLTTAPAATPEAPATERDPPDPLTSLLLQRKNGRVMTIEPDGHHWPSSPSTTRSQSYANAASGSVPRGDSCSKRCSLPTPTRSPFV
jgi:hypothetical protein